MKKKYFNYTYYTSAFILMLTVFCTNLFGILDPSFKNFQKDDERLVLGRLILTRNDGMFEKSGLVGIYGEWGDTLLNHELIYLNNIKIDKKLYNTYQSQIGGQGLIYSIFDALLPFNSKNKLFIFHFLTAFLTSLTFTCFLIWVKKHFNIITSIISFFLIISSFWIIIFSNKLWWNLWSFYLPFIFILFYLDNKDIGKINKKKLIYYSSIFVFVKCFITGYDYISSSLIMFTTPILFYHVLYNWEFKKTFKLFVNICIGAFYGFIFSIAILIFQISILDKRENNWSGIRYIYETVIRRSYDNPDINKGILFYNSMKSSVWETIQLYLDGPAYKYKYGNQIEYQISFFQFILFFICLTLIYFLNRRNIIQSSHIKFKALILMFWASILAPISWFVLFKSHSYIHTHINFIVWYMPFALLGYVLLGYFVSKTLINILKKPIQFINSKINSCH